VSNDDLPADLTVRVSRKDLEALGKGKLNPMTAVIGGRMQLSDMGLAMSLQPQMQALFAKIA
jgi:putative sterol carrier protein